MSAIESPPSTPAVPPWLSPSSATEVLGRASSVLAGQSWLDEGDLHWSGWGEPAELVVSMPGRWVVSPGPLSEASTASLSGPMAAAGVHVMVDRLARDERRRLDGFARLWNMVAVDGLISFTYPVHAGPEVSDAPPMDEEILVDHRRLVEELLLATSGRLLSADMVVHHPESATTGITWATLVLRRLR